MHLFDALTEWLLAASSSPIALLVVFACTVIDSFFPPIPSESLVVSLASLSVSSGSPSLPILGVVAATAAIIGDNIAYLIGRRVGTSRLRLLQRPRIAASLERARSGLRSRGAMVILTGRFIPVGRIAINMAAGATGYPRRAFVGLSTVAGALWAGYSIGIGVLAGRWVADNPLLGTVVAIVGAMVLGWVIEFVRGRVVRRRGGRTGTRLPAPTSPTVEFRLPAGVD
ncbi:MAG: DedA family protein [Propionibacteriaceae bacterium]